MIIQKLYIQIKRRIKLKHFYKKAECGANLAVSEAAHVIIQKNGYCKIGDNCDIQGLLFCNNGKIIIGANTTVRYATVINAVNEIIIGNQVIISNNVHIYDSNSHPTNPQVRNDMCLKGFYHRQWDWVCSENKRIIINDNVWIGERATILKGVEIGKGSIVGCDSVVSKDVPEYCIVAGNPAKIVKYLPHC